MKRRLLIASLLLGSGMGVVVAAALGATGMKGSAESGRRDVNDDGGMLLIGTTAFDYIDPALVVDASVNPATSVGLAMWAVEDATCATLLRYRAGRPTAQDYRLEPEVARGYPAVSRDGRTYTFTIRKDYRFNTGVRVTALNYAHAIDRVLNPVMGSPAAPYLQEIVGADAMQQGAQSASGVNVKGEKLIIHLTKKVPDFPARMTMPYLCPVPTDLPPDPEGVGAPLPGSGPYYFAEFVSGNRVVLRRNRYYRGPRVHHVDQFVVQVATNSDTVSRQVEAGMLDVDLNVPVPRLDELGAKYVVNATRLFSVPSANMFYLFMNTERPLFRHNVKLRQAVNFALDRPKMLSGLGPSWSGTVTDDYLPPGVPGYVDAHLYPLKHPDFKTAHTLANGHTRSGKAVMYTCESSVTGCLENAQTVQKDLKRIGIDVEIKQFPLTAPSRTAIRGEPFDLSFGKLIVPWVDPYQYANRLLDGRTIQPTGNTDRSYFNSSQYNRLMDQANALSGSARDEAYGRLAVDIARNAAPLAAAFVRNTRFFFSNRVGCVSVSAHGLDLAGLCLRK